MKVTDEKNLTLAVLGAGECFGETALLTGAPRNATVRCVSERCALVSLDCAEFHRIVRRSTVVEDALEGVAKSRSRREASSSASSGGPAS